MRAICFAVIFILFAGVSGAPADMGWRGEPPTRAEQIRIWRTIKRVAMKEGVSAKFLASIAIVESGDLNPRLMGRDGERGFLQLMAHQSSRINGTPEDLWDVENQIKAACRHVKEQNRLVRDPKILRAARKHPVLRRHGLYTARWLTAIGYNWGSIAYHLERYGARAKIPASSIRYACTVRQVYNKLR